MSVVDKARRPAEHPDLVILSHNKIQMLKRGEDVEMEEWGEKKCEEEE